MEIKALGGCCKKSSKNFENIKQAAKKMKLDVVVEQIGDMNEIMKYGVVATPGLVINGRAVSSGRLLSVSDAMAMIKRHI